MDRDFWIDFIAGWIGGCAGLVAGHPLDTIKVRQQVMKKMSAFRCTVNTIKHESVRGLYKGMAGPLLTTGTMNSLFFGVYGSTLRLQMNSQKELPTFTQVFNAGCAGGVVQLIVATPVELVKIKMQMQTGTKSNSWKPETTSNYKSPFACLKDIYKNHGIKGCYKGMVPMAIRDIPTFGFYMCIYEWFIRKVSGPDQHPSVLALILSGGMAGSLSWITAVPIDVIKSRFQADDLSNPKYKNLRDCIIKSYRKEGISVFYRGLFMVTIRAIPTNSAIFLAYSTSMKHMRAAFGSNYDDNEYEDSPDSDKLYKN